MPCESDRFQFEDGGVYQGDYENQQAHGFGIFTASGSGRAVEYAGAWKFGFELSGVYSWNAGRQYYAGQWSEGKRHGSGVEKRNDWIYKGEWSNGFKGRYGARYSCSNETKYEGTWTSGLQDGYGVETYSDGGVYQGQWLRGLRHGYGTRISAIYSKAYAKHKSSLTKPAIAKPTAVIPTSVKSIAAVKPIAIISQNSIINTFRFNTAPGNVDLDRILTERSDRIQFLAGGYVLVDSIPEVDDSTKGFHRIRLSLRETMTSEWKTNRKPKTGSTADVTGSASETPKNTPPSFRFFRHRPSLSAIDSSALAPNSKAFIQTTCLRSSFVDLIGPGLEIINGNMVEKYQGEWKQDKRTGYGVCLRSDGLKYEGEWMNDRKHGYGITTLPNGRQLVGKYKNNVLVSSAGDISGTRKRFDFLMPSLRSSTIRERAESAAQMAQASANNAMQKADIALIRMDSAKVKATEADLKATEAEKNEQSARFRIGEISSFDSKPGVNLQINRQLEGNMLAEYDIGLHGLQDFQQTTNVAPKGFSLFRSRKPRLSLAEREQLSRKLDVEEILYNAVDTFTGDQQMLAALHPKTSSTDHINSLQFSPELDHSPAGKHFEGLQSAPLFADLSGEAITVQQIQAPQFFANRPRMANQQNSISRNSTASAPLAYHNTLDLVTRYDRRNSLPSIYKEKSGNAPTQKTVPTPTVTATSSPLPPPPAQKHPEKVDTFVVVKGVRKRVHSLFEDPTAGPNEANTMKRGDSALASLLKKTMQASFAVASRSSRAWSHANPDDNLEPLYKIESPKMRRKGSTPDVSAIHPSEVMPREEVYEMSQRKREQRIKERAETDERRRQNEIVISFTNVKDWLTLFVVIINASLVAVFYNMLSQP